MTHDMFRFNVADAFLSKTSALRTGDSWGTGAKTPPANPWGHTPQPTDAWGNPQPAGNANNGWCSMTGGLGSSTGADSSNSGWCHVTGGLKSDNNNGGGSGGLGW